MKVLSSVFIALSLLSLLSGIGYLVVGNNSNTADTNFSPVSGYVQIVLALLVFLSAVAFKKYGNKFKVAFLGTASLYLAFMIYVLL